MTSAGKSDEHGLKLVEASRGHAYVDSSVVARKFGMKHAYLVSVIESILDAYPDLRAHAVARQSDYRGNAYVSYEMSPKLLALVLLRVESAKELAPKLVEQADLASKLMQALEAFDLDDISVPDMFLYAVVNRDTGNIKIGISRDPERRLSQLQVGCDGELQLLLVMEAPNRFADERAAHVRASANHLRGEWFKPDAWTALSRDRAGKCSVPIRR